jgi:hypothetical protein
MALNKLRQSVACPFPHDDDTERPKITKCILAPGETFTSLLG